MAVNAEVLTSARRKECGKKYSKIGCIGIK